MHHRGVPAVVLIILAIETVNAIPGAQDPDLEKLIENIFSPTPSISEVQAPKQTEDKLFQNTFDTSLSPSPDELGCVCVAYYLCSDGIVSTDGAIKTSNSDSSKNKFECPSYFDVCCNIPTEATSKIPLTFTQKLSCGRRNDQGSDTLVEGNEAKFAEFPWMITLLKKQKGNLVYMCGGSLIHEQVILTSAHCVKNRNLEEIEIYARAGEWNREATNEPIPHQDRRVDEIIVHENFSSGALRNDIALVILEEPFTLADNVDIICLPANNIDHSTSKNCFISGFGKNKFGKDGNYQTTLKKVQLPMISNDKCQETLRSTRLGSYFKLHETFICAGGIPGQDACKGDGGGPLMCPVEGKKGIYKQVGIVSWGIGCGSEVPGVYVNVPYYKTWIDHWMQRNYFRIDYNYAF